VGWSLQKCAPSACRAGAREAMHLVCTRAQNASRCRQGAWLHGHPPDTHARTTFADSTPPGSPVEELTSYARGDREFLRLGGGACFGGRNAEPPTRPPPPSRTPGCKRGSPGGRRGVLATPSYTLVYEKVVAVELVVRRFSPQNAPLPPAVKTAGPPWRKKLVLPRGNPVGGGLQKCAPSACRAGAREAMHLVCTRAQNASRCRQGPPSHKPPTSTFEMNNAWASLMAKPVMNEEDERRKRQRKVDAGVREAAGGSGFRFEALQDCL
jgi:hypothetical protein